MSIERVHTVRHKDKRNSLTISLDESKKLVTIDAIKHRLEQRDEDEPCELDLQSWRTILRELVEITPGLSLDDGDYWRDR